MSDTPVPQPAEQPKAHPLVGQEVTAFGFRNPSADDPEERSGPFEGQLYAVANPHTGETALYVGTSEVDPATVVPLAR